MKWVGDIVVEHFVVKRLCLIVMYFALWVFFFFSMLLQTQREFPERLLKISQTKHTKSLLEQPLLSVMEKIFVTVWFFC